MKKNKIIPFSLLFITLTFLELFCIVKYSDVFYFPLAVGVTMLGSAYLLLAEIRSAIVSYLKEKDKPNDANIDEAAADKEEASKIAKATYVLEKRILNLLEERLLMPEENMENLSMLEGEIVRAIKASIKYDRENTNHIAEIISSNSGSADNSMSPADLNQIISKFDALATELSNNRLTMELIKDQLQAITDIARQISNSKGQYAGQADADNASYDFDEPVTIPAESVTFNIAPDFVDPTEEMISPIAEEIASEPVTEEIASKPVTEAMPAEEIVSEIEAPEEDIPEFVDTLTMSGDKENTANNDEDSELMPEFVDTLSESVPVSVEPALVADDPNKKMSPEDIAALFASAEPEPEPALDEPAPVADDPNKKMSPEDIAALFASAEPEPAPVADDPNKKMSPEDIAALFASSNLELEPEPSAPAAKTAIETLSKAAPEVTPVSDDPNKKMSPEDIAALFASAGQ